MLIIVVYASCRDNQFSDECPIDREYLSAVLIYKILSSMETVFSEMSNLVWVVKIADYCIVRELIWK